MNGDVDSDNGCKRPTRSKPDPTPGPEVEAFIWDGGLLLQSTGTDGLWMQASGLADLGGCQ
jgi:hypothetical protein